MLRNQLISACLCASVFLLDLATAFAQTSSCPPNIDFSMGDFSFWECRTGTVHGSPGSNFVTWESAGPVGTRHIMITPQNNQIDYYGGFPVKCPYTKSFNVRLGNETGFHEAEGISYTYTIAPDNHNFSLLYYYAVVLQDPGHGPYEQPRFRARVIDVDTETELSCVSFDYVSGSSLPGFRLSDKGNVRVKDWTPASVDLSAYAGKTIRIEFISSDCIYTEHFGYAYISLSPVCNGSVRGGYYCEGDTSVKFMAPYGFQNYHWYSDNSFSTMISHSPNLVVNPAITPVGTVLPLIIEPYAGFGCADTLYATLQDASIPVANAGADKTVCSRSTVQLGAANNADYSYAWQPAELLSDPLASDPFTRTGLQQITPFIIQSTNIITGCVGTDTTIITPYIIDTTVTVTGKLLYCPGETLNSNFLLANTGASIQWIRGTTPLTSETLPAFVPATSGSYYAALQMGGCFDTSRRLDIYYSAVPKPGFFRDKEVQCVTKPVSFINTSTIAGNAPLSYIWTCSDGFSTTTKNFDRTFSHSGVYTLNLKVASEANCVDSVTKTIRIVDNCFPVMPDAFTPDGDGLNDRIKPLLPGIRQLKKFSIFNRWGDLVFSTSKEGDGWDGNYKGSPQGSAVFVWMLEYVAADSKLVTEKGTFTLIR